MSDRIPHTPLRQVHGDPSLAAQSQPTRRTRDRFLARPGSTRRQAREAIAAARRAEAIAHTAVAVITQDDCRPATTFTDPAAARVQARRQRIAASGLTLVRGGAR